MPSVSLHTICTVCRCHITLCAQCFVKLSGDSVGGMELRVGSNMLIFRYIYPLLIWHMYLFGVCILYIVSCHNYTYCVCET